MHDGECGNHSGGRSLANRISRQGYYWPTLREDAMRYVQRCDACQRHSGTSHLPSEPLHSVLIPWPFMRWGMDIVGKFGVPSEIMCDNGSQFISEKTRKFCDERGIRLITSTPRHPQSNGLAESSNKVIINSIRKRLKEAKGKWVEELPSVLWANRTTPRTSTGQTPFSLVYGCEAIDDSDSSQHLGSTISPFEKKSEWWWKLQCRLPLGHLQVLFPLAYDPCSHLHRSLCPSVHHPLLKLLLDQPHCLQQLSFSIYDSPTWYLIRQQSALHAIVDIKEGPVAEPGELSKPHKPALLLLPSHVKDSMLRYPGWHVRRVGIDTRNEQVWSKQVDLRLAAFEGKLVVRHSCERDCVTDVFLQYLRAISVVLWSEDRALEVLDDREKVF
ncbi:hypothetical protein OSB04_006717 [Centaurea solstitialis]|uniref:Integrase catalytic domain-containing protein n=1 Tax=Centaurea solstitialis TaxID=347529 RepID=A0AA38WHX5_9ASTR|nr:hypothetical protein OSB04_006717 [Centaurea solstitialis]